MLGSIEPVPGPPCETYGGYSDIAAGMEVKLRADGQILDVARLGPGTFGAKPAKGAKMECRFDFSLQVPSGHRFYTVETGRGSQTYSFEGLTSGKPLAESRADRVPPDGEPATVPVRRQGSCPNPKTRCSLVLDPARNQPTVCRFWQRCMPQLAGDFTPSPMRLTVCPRRRCRDQRLRRHLPPNFRDNSSSV